MGSPVFNTGGAAPGVARWVRLPCAPATFRSASDGVVSDPRDPPGPGTRSPRELQAIAIVEAMPGARLSGVETFTG